MATAQEIQGLYTGLLGRAPDQAGLDYWTQQAAGGMSIDAIRQSFQSVASAGTDPLKGQANPLLPPPPPPAQAAPQPAAQANPLTGQTYAAHDPALLARATAIGDQIRDTNAGYGNPLLAQYQSAMEDMIYGTNPTGVKPQAGEAIAAIYQNELGRAPDAEGLAYWSDQFNSGQTLEQIQANIDRGTEAQGRGNVYHDRPMFAGNEWTSPALAGRGIAQMGLPGLSQTPGPNAPAASRPAPATSSPGMGHNNPPPGPANPLVPRETTPPTAALTTRPPTRFASEYPYESPVARQMAAANDQRATPMTQPVGFASDNPLLNRFGTQRLGEYTGARETPGNVPGPFRPTVNPLPGIVGAAPGASSGSSGSSGLPDSASSVLLAAAPALAGMAVPAALDLISKIPGGGAVADKIAGVLGANELAGGNITFGELLKHPSLGTVVGSALAGLPDILSGDYAQGIGAGLGSYIGATAGTAVGAGIGGIAGNFIIPGLGGAVGAFIGRKAGGLFGPGASVGPNGGQSMEFDRTTGKLVPGPSGQDNSGSGELGFANKFMQGVADVVNEANAQSGGQYKANYSPSLPVAVEIIGGKINVVDHEGNKQSFAGNDVENAFKYAVGVATAYPGLRLPG